MQNNRSSFKKTYLVFLGILAIIMAACLIYVGSVLTDYESSQPENIAIAEFKVMQKAAKGKKLGSLLSNYEDSAITADEIAKAETKIASAGGKVTSKLLKNEDGGEKLTYAILAGDERVAEVTVRSTGNNKTKLAILTLAEWETEFMGPARYEYDMTLPASMTVLLNGETVDGTEDGGNRKYSFSSYVDKPDVIVRDSLGHEIKYDGASKLSITKYTVQLPSNYNITTEDGSYTVPVSSAALTDVDSYRYISQYTEMPKTATYSLGLFDDASKFVIKDNLGNNVPYSLDSHTVKIDAQPSFTEIPEDIYSADDILANARTWNLFMTDDLTGNTNGFGQVEKFLLPDSYLMEVAYKWATGIDITFTSIHTLDRPPFSEENVSGYVKYNDSCFSADIKLVKTMHLNTGEDVVDTMNCRFYYINKDGEWYVADIQEIISEQP